MSVRFEGEKATYQINWMELLDLEEKPVTLDDLVNGMQVLAPYYKADGQIAHHAATVCSKSVGSGKPSAAEGDGTDEFSMCTRIVCACVCVSMCRAEPCVGEYKRM